MLYEYPSLIHILPLFLIHPVLKNVILKMESMPAVCMSSSVIHVRYVEPLTTGGPGGGVAGAGVNGGLSGFNSCFSFSGPFSSSGRRGSGGGGARFGHWPISAFSNETGWEKSERL